MKRLIVSLLLILLAGVGYGQTITYGNWHCRTSGNLLDGYTYSASLTGIGQFTRFRVDIQPDVNLITIQLTPSSHNSAAAPWHKTEPIIFITDKLEEPHQFDDGFYWIDQNTLFTDVVESMAAILGEMISASEVMFRTTYDSETRDFVFRQEPLDMSRAMHWLFEHIRPEEEE